MLQTNPEKPNGLFDMPEKFLAGLGSDVTSRLIAAAADLVLIVDEAGVIQDLACGSDDLRSHAQQQWLGKPWLQTVTVESRPKVEAMLKEASAGGSAKWRHVNHPSSAADGDDMAVSYSVVPVGPPGEQKTPGAGHSVAFGRDLRAQMTLQQRLVSAQMSMERDYWRLRNIETRYRLLFQESTEALMILDAGSERLEEANPAAFRLLGEGARRTAWTLSDSLRIDSARDLQQSLARLRSSGRPESLSLTLLDSADALSATVSLFRQENSTHFMVRLGRSPDSAPRDDERNRQQISNILESAPDALVVTDLSGHVLTANRAFLELVQVASEEQARGESLEKWLGRSGVDLNVLIANLRQRGSVRLFATRMKGNYGSMADVEISAVSVSSGEDPCMGFVIRDVGRRLPADARAQKELPRSAGQMTELVGRVPLRDIVRETTDLIERLCIEAALELTSDNRASAAEMLGLSRQSLYVKLRRFGLGDLDPSPGGE